MIKKSTRKKVFALQGILSIIATLLLLAATLVMPLITVKVDNDSSLNKVFLAEAVETIGAAEEEKKTLTEEDSKRYTAYLAELFGEIEEENGAEETESDDETTDENAEANLKILALYTAVSTAKSAYNHADTTEERNACREQIAEARKELLTALGEITPKSEKKEVERSFSFSFIDYAINSVKLIPIISLVEEYRTIDRYYKEMAKYPNSSDSYKKKINDSLAKIEKNKESYVGCLNDVTFGLVRYFYNKEMPEKSVSAEKCEAEDLYELYVGGQSFTGGIVLKFTFVVFALLTSLITAIIAAINLIKRLIKTLILLGKPTALFAYGVSSFPSSLRIFTIGKVTSCLFLSFAFGQASVSGLFIALTVFAVVVAAINFVGGRLSGFEKEELKALNIVQAVSLSIIAFSVIALTVFGGSGAMRAILSNLGAFALIRKYGYAVSVALTLFSAIGMGFVAIITVSTITSAAKVVTTSFADFGKGLKKGVTPTIYNSIGAFGKGLTIMSLILTIPTVICCLAIPQFATSGIITAVMIALILVAQITVKILLGKLAPSVDFEKMKKLVDSAQFEE